jgi:S1-C subfamily serine protease
VAKAAGFKMGDVVLSVNGTTVNDLNGLLAAITEAPGGRPTPIVLWTAKPRRQMPVTFERRGTIAVRPVCK